MATTRNGVTYSDAAAEAYVYAPITRAMLYAYELWHPTMAEPVRFVNDAADMTATLEAAAPRDPSGDVLFIGVPMAASRPEESETAAAPSVTLQRPDVAGLLRPLLDAARGDLEPWELIERCYASDDLTTPALLPVRTYEVTSIDIAGSAVSLSASFGDLVNTAVPRSSFRKSQYPGLGR